MVIYIYPDQLLKNNIVQKRIEFFKNKCEESVEPTLLQTIKIPKNISFLADKLPKSNYDNIHHIKQSFNYEEYIKKKSSRRIVNSEFIAHSADNRYNLPNISISPNLASSEMNKLEYQ